jgi:AcrR family transcriptional regulator
MTPAVMPERPAKRETDKARATREWLIELAAELFAEHGYVQTSIRDISKKGALTSGAIYGHFRNKADLLAAAISAKTSEELEARSLAFGHDADFIETLTRLARHYPDRRQLRALIVQGAAAAQTDEETRDNLREEQLSHLESWLDQYEAHRDRMGIDPAVDMQAAVLGTWAMELGLGVLEAIGIEPRSAKGWSDVQNRLARSLQLPPDPKDRRPPRRGRSKPSSRLTERKAPPSTG